MRRLDDKEFLVKISCVINWWLTVRPDWNESNMIEAASTRLDRYRFCADALGSALIVTIAVCLDHDRRGRLGVALDCQQACRLQALQFCAGRRAWQTCLATLLRQSFFIYRGWWTSSEDLTSRSKTVYSFVDGFWNSFGGCPLFNILGRLRHRCGVFEVSLLFLSWMC